MENRNRGIVLLLTLIVLILLGTRSQAQSYEYPVEIDLSKGLSKVSLVVTEEHPEFIDAEQIIVSSVFFDKLLVPTKHKRNKVQLLSRKEFREVVKAGETFDIEFYKGGTIIYKLTVIPTRHEASCYYQEVGGSNWIGWLR